MANILVNIRQCNVWIQKQLLQLSAFLKIISRNEVLLIPNRGGHDWGFVRSIKRSDIFDSKEPTGLTMTIVGHNRSSGIPGRTPDLQVPLGFGAAWISSLSSSSVAVVWRKEVGTRKAGPIQQNFQVMNCATAFLVLWAAKERKCRNAGMSCSACAALYTRTYHHLNILDARLGTHSCLI